MNTRARSLFTMGLVMALFITAVLVPSTSEAKYKKRVLPSACEGATVEPFWEDKSIRIVGGEESLFFVGMAALDPYTGGETVVAKAKWESLCDKQREAYLTWFESVVRTAVYLVGDYRINGPQVFGGMSYPDADGETEKLDPMPLDEIADLLLQPATLLDVVAAGRPGTPRGTLSGFTSNVCRLTGTGCHRKAPARAPAACRPDGTSQPCPPPPAPPAPSGLVP